MSDATSGSAREPPGQALHCGSSNSSLSRTVNRQDMVTPADFTAFQQQLRQEVTDVMQQLRAEVNDAISGRMDMLNSINTALQNVSARPAENKPYRISDFIPRNWEGNNEKGELRSFMSDLHLWMQGWSNQGEKMLAIVEGVDMLDHNAIAFDCSDDELRSIETSLYQVLHRRTSNEPLRIVQQTRGQRGFEAWHAIVRRYDQRNMSDKKSAYAAWISNISEKDRAKDVEQFDDILRTFINEMNKFESRFGAIRDEEKMLAVKKLMPESLLNYRFRGTTVSYSEIIVALENIIVDMVSTIPSSKSRKTDTSAPMEIGMTAKETEKVRAKKEIIELWISRCRLSTMEQAKENGDSAKVKIGMRRAAKVARMEERIRGKRAAAKKEEKGKRNVAKENPERVGRTARQDTLQLGAEREETQNLYAIDQDGSENAEESNENEEGLQAWCLLEGSENELWQEVISKQNKRRVKKDNQASLLSMENSHNSNPKKMVEVKDKWVTVRVTMVSGAAGHVMPETTFPRFKLERKTTPKKLVAREQIKDLGEKTIPFKTKEGIQRCKTFSKCCQTPHCNAKGRPSRKHCGAG